MAIPERFIEEIKDRVSVSEVLGKRMRLIPNGREFKGLCPFHQEKTPSFTVNDEKGFYYCFGCGAKGNQISFLMEHDKQSFPEAIESLASMAGMVMPQSSPQDIERERRQSELGDIVTVAADFYRNQLSTNAAGIARDYLARRGLSPASVDRFGLGYSPPSSRGSISPLVAHLAGQGFTEAQMVEAGLARIPDDGRPAYDFFRDRLMFTITSAKNKPIGFGARILGEGEPKYLNSPDGPLFDKGRTLYGLAQARDAARSKGRLIVTEGYMDVIALAEAGFTEAVAPLGTAITENHFLAAWRSAPDVVMCFDGDNAGQRAAMRAAERCLSVMRTGKRVSFCSLPKGEDPDTFVRSYGIEAFARILEGARPLSEQLWMTSAASTGNRTPDALSADRKKLRDLAEKIPDPDLSQSYRSLFNDRLNSIQRPSSVVGRGANFANRGSQGAARGNWRTRGSGFQGRLQSSSTPAAWMQRHQFEVLFAALLHHPEITSRFDEQIGELSIPFADLAELRDCLIDCVADQETLDSESVKCHLAETGTVAETAQNLEQKSKRFSEEGARKSHDHHQAERLVGHLLEVIVT